MRNHCWPPVPTSIGLIGVLERIGSDAERWWSRIEKLCKGRLLGRFFAASRERLREVARGRRRQALSKRVNGGASYFDRSTTRRLPPPILPNKLKQNIILRIRMPPILPKCLRLLHADLSTDNATPFFLRCQILIDPVLAK
jgi:hypothetical protein